MQINYNQSIIKDQRFRLLKLYKVVITSKQSHQDRDSLQIKWQDMDFNFFTRWKWYFEYRLALAKINNPKGVNEMQIITYEPETRTQKQIATRRIKKLIAARKRKLTENWNKLHKMKNNWNELLPITEHPKHINTINKLEKLQIELFNYQLKLKNLTK